MQKIYRKEWYLVVLFGLMLGIRALGKTVGWSTVQTILVKRFGLETMPYSFILFSILCMVGSFFYLIFADSVRRDFLLNAYTFFTGFSLLIASFFVPSLHAQFGLDAALFSILVMAAYGLGDAVIPAQIWTLINDTFTPAQGIRLYPVIILGSLFGDILGGYALRNISRYVPPEIWIAIWGMLTLAIIPITLVFRGMAAETIDVQNAELRKRKSMQTNVWHNLEEGYSYCQRSPLVYCISGICILFWALASLKEFQYVQILHAYTTETTLNEYYGGYAMFLNVAVVAFQIFFTSQIVKTIGVGWGLCILPVTIFCGISLIFLFPSPFSAFTMRFTWDIVAMTIQGSSYQLSFHAVPTFYRGRVRGFLDGIMNPIGGILGGVIIISLNEVFSTTKNPTEFNFLITILGLVGSFLWLSAALKAKKYWNQRAMGEKNFSHWIGNDTTGRNC